ncbi:hypothetical protein AB1699_20395 [Pseudomonas synxantha]
MLSNCSPHLCNGYPALIENEKLGKQLARQALERRRTDYQLAEGKSDQPTPPGVRIVVASSVFPEKAYRGRKETGRAVLFT